MGRKSNLNVPVAQLCALEGITLQTFAARHGLSFNTAMKICSEKSALTLPADSANELALLYGIDARSLAQKTGPLLGLDGEPASAAKINSWRSIRNLSPESASALTREARREVHELFAAALEIGEGLKLALEFSRWRSELIAGSPRLRRALEDRNTEPTGTDERRSVTPGEVDKLARQTPAWEAIKDAAKSKGKAGAPYDRMTVTRYRPLGKMLRFIQATGAPVMIAFGTRVRRVRIRLLRGTGRRVEESIFDVETYTESRIITGPPESIRLPEAIRLEGGEKKSHPSRAKKQR